jgi:ubiquinone/menaquinone biosynthesis C-methylase UbiE
MKGTGGFLNPEQTIKQLNIEKGMVIADFGCGAGYFTVPLAKIVGEQGKIYALDVLETALESVRSRAKLEGLLNIETKRCNLEVSVGSGIDNNSVDWILLHNILFQSDDKSDIIKEAVRILKKGGKISAIDWKENQPMGPSKELVVSIESVKKIAEQSGLKFRSEMNVDNYHWGMIFEKV